MQHRAPMKFDPSANVTASTIASRCALLLASSSIDGHGNLQQNNTQRRGASDPEIEAFPSHDSLHYLEFTSLIGGIQFGFGPR
jgi:hypothetical protein